LSTLAVAVGLAINVYQGCTAGFIYTRILDVKSDKVPILNSLFSLLLLIILSILLSIIFIDI